MICSADKPLIRDYAIFNPEHHPDFRVLSEHTIPRFGIVYIGPRSKDENRLPEEVEFPERFEYKCCNHCKVVWATKKAEYISD